MITTPFEMANSFVGVAEINGLVDNSLVLAFLRVDDTWPEHDEVPWCSGFMNFICKCCGLERSKSLAAKSWLMIGKGIDISDAQLGFDIAILSRVGGNHVGFYVKHDDKTIWLLAGNQGNKVSVASFPRDSVIAVRRLE